ncbi:hypothetical protein F7725_019355 [Dissostichus mawsoni]|uniref:Uncharacterized protein n=1 Tax=Dissostichus mawsoni TaxID=36200 RepID=A0A7J5YJG3_DISMA|nr:hypothetical protein F7725_019355 [Dissostichus mawsoni]
MGRLRHGWLATLTAEPKKTYTPSQCALTKALPSSSSDCNHEQNLNGFSMSEEKGSFALSAPLHLKVQEKREKGENNMVFSFEIKPLKRASSVGACSGAHWQVRGAVGLVCTTQSERGGAASGEKWPHGVPAPSMQSLTSQILRRAGSSERRVCQVLSTPLGDVQRSAQTGYLPSSTQPPPEHSVVPYAVKCNSSLCGIKTAFIHRQLRCETRTNIGGQEQQRTAGEPPIKPGCRSISALRLSDSHSSPGVDGNTPKI